MEEVSVVGPHPMGYGRPVWLNDFLVSCTLNSVKHTFAMLRLTILIVRSPLSTIFKV